MGLAVGALIGAAAASVLLASASPSVAGSPPLERPRFAGARRDGHASHPQTAKSILLCLRWVALRTAGNALTGAIQEARIQGVSTRSVGEGPVSFAHLIRLLRLRRLLSWLLSNAPCSCSIVSTIAFPQYAATWPQQGSSTMSHRGRPPPRAFVCGSQFPFAVGRRVPA